MNLTPVIMTILLAVALSADDHHPAFIWADSLNLCHLPNTFPTEYVNRTDNNRFTGMEHLSCKEWAADVPDNPVWYNFLSSI